MFSEWAKGEFRGMTAKESTALCDHVVIFHKRKEKYDTVVGKQSNIAEKSDTKNLEQTDR